MEVIARCGARVLVQFAGRDANRPLKLVLGCVVDTRQRRVFSARGVDTILAHGYWEPFVGDAEPVLTLVRSALHSRVNRSPLKALSEEP
jgi:hypothetical protein